MVHSLAMVLFALVTLSMSLVALAPTGGAASRCTIMGTNAREMIVGTRGDDIICGKGGRDRIFGRGGDDWLYGQDGWDRLHGGDGNDHLVGGAGDDYFRGGSGNDHWYGGPDRDFLVDYHGIDIIEGGWGDDVCLSTSDDAGGDTVIGGPGRDVRHTDPHDTVVSAEVKVFCDGD